MAGIGQDRPELVFGSLFGAGVFVTAAVAGAVSLTRPFKLMERPFLRDVSFYLICGFWAFFIFWRQEIRLADSAGFLLVYLVYIVVVVVGRWLHQRSRTDLPYSPQVEAGQEEEEKEADMAVARPTLTGDPPEIQLVPESPGCTPAATNLLLLLAALNPVNREEWQAARWWGRCYQITKAPVDLLFR